MRRVRVVAWLLGPSLVLASVLTPAGPGGASSEYPPTPTTAQCTKIVRSEVTDKGHLTIATDNPVLAPWFVKNDPTDHAGYEDVLAYDIAHALGFTNKQVRWVVEPYASSYLAGSKKFDFDIDEIVYRSSLTANVSFSKSYYNVQQSIVAMKSDKIVHEHDPSQLRGYHYGAIAGSPAATYVTKVIKPKAKVATYATLTLAETALEDGAVDALVMDTPTGNHAVTWDLIAADDAPLAVQVAQFPYDSDEYYALLTQHRDPIVGCLNAALRSLTSSGTISRLKKKWLPIYQKVPVIRP